MEEFFNTLERSRKFAVARYKLASELRRSIFLRLSEKGHEQRLERGFSRYTERKEGPRVLCIVTLQAPPTLFGQPQ